MSASRPETTVATQQPHLPMLASAIAPSERTYQTDVLELFGVLGWRAIHHHPLRTKHGWRTGVEGPGCAGFPDVLAVRGQRIVAGELKSRTGRIGADQRAWLDALAQAGVECYVWHAGRDTLQTIAGALRQTAAAV